MDNQSNEKNIVYLVTGIAAHKVKKLVYVSSAGAIPELPHGMPITEINHFEPQAVVGFSPKRKPQQRRLYWMQCVTMKQMFHMLSELTGTKEVKVILPVPIARFFGKLSDLGEKIVGKPARMTSFAVYNLVRNNLFDCSKAKRELGYHTRPFAESIADTINWLERENKIRIRRTA